MSKPLRFIMLGTGFWARYQLAGWREVPGLECVGVWNRTREKAEAFARHHAVDRVFSSAEEACAAGGVDFIDIITDVESHPALAKLAMAHGKHVVCQKPVASSAALAHEMIDGAARSGVSLLVNENWRWQAPIRALDKVLRAGTIGRVFRARLDFMNGFDVFENQPFLRAVSRFILADLGIHILDTARFLFGEPDTVYARTHRVHTDIAGEDVATVMLGFPDDVTVVCSLSYAGNPYANHVFPETLALVEGDQGSAALARDGWLHVTTSSGTESFQIPSPVYAWADPQYAVVHASIVSCQHHLAGALRGETLPETPAADNINTLRLVEEAYHSADHNTLIHR